MPMFRVHLCFIVGDQKNGLFSILENALLSHCQAVLWILDPKVLHRASHRIENAEAARHVT